MGRGCPDRRPPSCRLGRDLPSGCPGTHLGCQVPELLLSQEGLFWGPSSGVPARSWSLQSSWSVAHLSLDFMLSCWESREMMSEGELITPESSVVSSDAKQLPTDTVSSASVSAGGTPSSLQGLPGPRSRLTGQNMAGTGQRTGQPALQFLHSTSATLTCLPHSKSGLHLSTTPPDTANLGRTTCPRVTESNTLPPNSAHYESVF